MAEPISFSPSILPSSRNLFIMGDFNCHHSLWNSKGTSNPRAKEVFDWIISSDLLPLMALTHPPFSIAPLLTSPLLPLLSLFLAPGRCFRTWILTIYQFFYPSLSLSGLSPQRTSPFPSSFRKLAGMALPSTLILTVPLQWNTRLFHFPLLMLSLPLWH